MVKLPSPLSNRKLQFTFTCNSIVTLRLRIHQWVLILFSKCLVQILIVLEFRLGKVFSLELIKYFKGSFCQIFISKQAITEFKSCIIYYHFEKYVWIFSKSISETF
jgi:hypothetical protein